MKVILPMKYIRSIIHWFLPNSDGINREAGWNTYNSINARLMYAVLSAIFLIIAFWFYRGSNARLLGPPFGPIGGQDFRQILRASQEIVDGKDIYQHAIPYAETPNFSEFKSWNAAPYPYSPIVAILAIPFLWFDENSVLKFWTFFSWLLLIGVGFIVVRGILADNNIFKLLSVLLFFALYGPTHLNLNLVQLDILILFFVSLTFFLYKSKSVFAGVFLGVAMSLKLLVAPMLIYFLWKKEWKTSILALLTFGTLTIIGFSVAGWEQLEGFIRVNYLWSVTDMLSYPFNQSINGLARRLFTVNSYIEPLLEFPSIVLIVRILSIVMAIFLWLKMVSHEDNRGSVEGFLEYGFTLSTMLFLSPLVDDIHYVWVLLPISSLLMVISFEAKNTRKFVFSLFALFCVLYLANPDLHDAIYYGWENLVNNHVLVSQKFGLLTGAYLYGLFGLELCLYAALSLFRQETYEKMTKSPLVVEKNSKGIF